MMRGGISLIARRVKMLATNVWRALLLATARSGGTNVWAGDHTEHNYTWHRRPRAYQFRSAMTASSAPMPDELAFVQRVLDAYRRTWSPEPYGQGMWRRVFDSQHKESHPVFLAGDVAAATDILRDPAGNNLQYGFGQGAQATKSLLENVSAREGAAWFCKMHLVTLAEALGIERVENPETYAAHLSPPDPETESLLRKIDAVLGFDVDFPNPFPHEAGLLTKRGVAGPRAIEALYHAYRIKCLGARSVVEIGGGQGRTGYYCWQLGVRDYTIVDLPFTMVSQASFLGSSLGSNAVSLDGEAIAQDRIRLICPHSFARETRGYDVFLNVDSLSEMPQEQSALYCEQFRGRGRRFLSINHESNRHTAHERLGSLEHTRHPYWMRRGYVEELYLNDRAG